MKYNDNINSIDSKLYINLIYYIIDSILSRQRFIFKFSFNYYFKNKPFFKLKSLIFNRVNQINQIKFNQKYKYSIKKLLSTLDIIINKLKYNRSLRRHEQLKIIKLSNSLRNHSFTFINHKRKLD